MVGRPHTFFNVSAIERRARDFKDPIERLRYLRRTTTLNQHQATWRNWVACLTLAVAVITLRSDATNRELPPRKTPVPALNRQASDTENVWPVEQTGAYDFYSNGLRIENRLAVSNEPRAYHLIYRDSAAIGPFRSQPAGIVFHTSESDQAPFEREQQSALNRIGHDLLLYVRNKRAYHFIIDRFGRVHRIVVESDTANHAGHSVWADSRWSYLDLNKSFLGVAFEASMQADRAIISDAQLRAGRALVEMLRAKYSLPAENCVVHAQVSVNPGNWRIGWHTDWGLGFPFRELGLPNNYQIPNPSLYLFGYEYDLAYTRVTGPDLWKGLATADERVAHAAAKKGLKLAEYRILLQHRFRDALSAVQQTNAEEENQHESN